MLQQSHYRSTIVRTMSANRNLHRYTLEQVKQLTTCHLPEYLWRSLTRVNTEVALLYSPLYHSIAFYERIQSFSLIRVTCIRTYIYSWILTFEYSLIRSNINTVTKYTNESLYSVMNIAKNEIFDSLKLIYGESLQPQWNITLLERCRSEFLKLRIMCTQQEEATLSWRKARSKTWQAENRDHSKQRNAIAIWLKVKKLFSQIQLALANLAKRKYIRFSKILRNSPANFRKSCASTSCNFPCVLCDMPGAFRSTWYRLWIITPRENRDTRYGLYHTPTPVRKINLRRRWTFRFCQIGESVWFSFRQLDFFLAIGEWRSASVNPAESSC